MATKTYSEKLKDPRWQKKRLEVLQRDNFTCTLCSDAETELHIHHKEYIYGNEVWNYENDNFQSLCKDCHLLVESIKEDNLTVLISIKTHISEKVVITAILKTELNELSVSLTYVENSKLHYIIEIGDNKLKGINNLLELAKKLI